MCRIKSAHHQGLENRRRKKMEIMDKIICPSCKGTGFRKFDLLDILFLIITFGLSEMLRGTCPRYCMRCGGRGRL